MTLYGMRRLVDFDAAFYARWRSNRELIGISIADDFWVDKNVKQHDSPLGQLIAQEFLSPSDCGLLARLVAAHGIFAERFFMFAIRQRVASRFAELGIGLAEFSRLCAEANNHSYTGFGLPHDIAIFRVLVEVFELTKIRIRDGQQGVADLETWIATFSQARTCILCHRPFRLVDLPDWVYFGSNARQDCCFQCKLPAPPLDKLPSLVRAFVKRCQFVPSSNATPITYSFTSRLPPEQWVDVMRAYRQMGGVAQVKQLYGSWFQGLALSGALPDGVLPTARGIRCLAVDGHVCHSLEEQRIDNWLQAHQLAHTKEPFYPMHADFNPRGRRRADWEVGGTLIEFFGLMGDPKYDAKHDEKIALAAALHLDLVAIYPADVEYLDERLSVLETGRHLH